MLAVPGGSHADGRRAEAEVVLRRHPDASPGEEGPRRRDRRRGRSARRRASRRDGGILALHGPHARAPETRQLQETMTWRGPGSTRRFTSTTGNAGPTRRSWAL